MDPPGGPGDKDADGVPDWEDNCVNDWNPVQEDSDCDRVGDACDNSPFPAANALGYDSYNPAQRDSNVDAEIVNCANKCSYNDFGPVTSSTTPAAVKLKAKHYTGDACDPAALARLDLLASTAIDLLPGTPACPPDLSLPPGSPITTGCSVVGNTLLDVHRSAYKSVLCESPGAVDHGFRFCEYRHRRTGRPHCKGAAPGSLRLRDGGCTIRPRSGESLEKDHRERWERGAVFDAALPCTPFGVVFGGGMGCDSMSHKMSWTIPFPPPTQPRSRRAFLSRAASSGHTCPTRQTSGYPTGLTVSARCLSPSGRASL
jgi:hypothetical protein